MDVEQPQHAGFIRPHLAAEADDIGEHDRRQLAGLRHRTCDCSSGTAAIMR